MFYRCFFLFFFAFFPSAINMRQPFSGTAERIFMKLLPNDTGENGVCNVVPPPGESRVAAWRHARRLRYKIMSARMDLIQFSLLLSNDHTQLDLLIGVHTNTPMTCLINGILYIISSEKCHEVNKLYIVSFASQAERQFKPCVNGDMSFLWEFL